MAGGIKLPGLNGQTAQSEGSAGTETTNTTTPSGENVPAVNPAAAAGSETAAPVIGANGLRNDPPVVVTGTSSSLVAPPDYSEIPEEDKSVMQKVQDSVAVQNLADQGVVSVDNATRWSSHPIRNYRVGRFVFDRGLLTLDADDNADFEKLLKGLPPVERARITKIDVEAAEQIVRDRMAAQQGSATKQFDSSVGERSSDVSKLGPTVGNVPLGFENRAQQDMNAPVVPTIPFDDKGDTGLDQGAHVPGESGADGNKQ